MIIGVPESLTR